MPGAANYALADLMGIAGATVGIIIAAAILRGGFDAKYIHLFERYRALTGEYRTDSTSDKRRAGLRPQINNYLRRIHLINLAALGMMGAVLLFVATVALASLSVVYPQVLALRFWGTVTLLVGFLLIALAVVLDLIELWLSRASIFPEIADFSGADPRQRKLS